MSSAQRAADRARIAQIEAEISNLHDMIERLRDEKAVADERLNSYHYPVLTLPTELVSEIFTHCLPVYPLAPPLEGPTSPTIFTEICRHWRDIALVTPGLWCAFRLENTHYRQRQLQTVQAWLDRSACRPLSIQMDLLRYYPDVELVRALVRERSRWEYVRLRVLLEQLPSDSAMPHLRHLELKSLTLHPQLPIAFQPHQIPSLHTVTLWDWTYPSGFLPWSQLRSLSLIGKEPEECTLRTSRPSSSPLSGASKFPIPSSRRTP
ncbi:hypothetical protein C8R46DRAFT_999174 [Mycena filopes]|nr:hypothetical protein C8R46DRAFT_999174 [Mycena filopes]